MKNNKLIKTLITTVTMLLVLLVPVGAYASEIPETATVSSIPSIEQPSDNELDSLPVIYTVKSKTFVGNLPKVFQKDWTTSWAKASSYQLMQGWSYTSTLTANVSAEILEGVIAQGSFTNSRTYTCNVTTTMPADSSRYSKLAHYRDYKQYNALIQCQAGVNPPYDVGTYTVKEPDINSYNIVRYQ